MSNEIFKFHGSLNRELKIRIQRLDIYDEIIQKVELSNKAAVEAILRGGVVELCAQLEGFCKSSIRQYLHYINSEIEDLSNVHVGLRTALAAHIFLQKTNNLLGKINNVGEINKFAHFYNEIFILFHEPDKSNRKELSQKFIKNFLEEKSGIDWNYFEELMWVVGIPIDEKVSAYEKSLNELIGRRNEIAHGDESLDKKGGPWLEIESETRVWGERLGMVRYIMKYIYDRIRIASEKNQFLITSKGEFSLEEFSPQDH